MLLLGLLSWDGGGFYGCRFPENPALPQILYLHLKETEEFETCDTFSHN